MIPKCVASMRATHVVEMNHAATGVVASITLTPDTITDAVAILDGADYLIEDITVTDLKEGFEITYHFSLFDGNSRLVLRVMVPHDRPKVPTISSVYPGADWHERECFDFFGIQFTDHPNLHNLLLSEDFNGHPLVKDAKHRKHLADVMPDAWALAVGLTSPEAPLPAHAQEASPKHAPGASKHGAHPAHKEESRTAHLADITPAAETRANAMAAGGSD